MNVNITDVNTRLFNISNWVWVVDLDNLLHKVFIYSIVGNRYFTDIDERDWVGNNMILGHV